MKHKRVWTDEQKAAARERMAKAREAKQVRTAVATVERECAPEVQAILDAMTPERKAKLAAIQAKNLANLAQTKDGREALGRLEARHSGTAETPKAAIAVAETPKPVPEPPKSIVQEVPMKVPFRITGSISGMVISELGVCQCGEQKLKWHPNCLRVKVNG